MSFTFREFLTLEVTAGFAGVGWLFRRFLTRLDSLTKETNAQSSALAALVERINPTTITLANHETRIRESENGLARLEGALAAYRETVQHATTAPAPVVPPM